LKNPLFPKFKNIRRPVKDKESGFHLALRKTNLSPASADLLHTVANRLLDIVRRIFTVYVLTDKIVRFISFSIDI
jgi:hypothetical protein